MIEAPFRESWSSNRGQPIDLEVVSLETATFGKNRGSAAHTLPGSGSSRPPSGFGKGCQYPRYGSANYHPKYEGGLSVLQYCSY